MRYHFKEIKETACLCCTHIIKDGDPVLYVSHDADGMWQFLCGKAHTEKDAQVVALEQVLHMDQTLNDLWEMPSGVSAERDSLGGTWVFRK